MNVSTIFEQYPTRPIVSLHSEYSNDTCMIAHSRIYCIHSQNMKQIHNLSKRISFLHKTVPKIDIILLCQLMQTTGIRILW